jgi:hypothetical protein
MKRLQVTDHTSRLALWGNLPGMLSDLAQAVYLDPWGHSPYPYSVNDPAGIDLSFRRRI